jgi:hypothetical protein
MLAQIFYDCYYFFCLSGRELKTFDLTDGDDIVGSLWRYKGKNVVKCDLGKMIVYKGRKTFVRKALT